MKNHLVYLRTISEFTPLHGRLDLFRHQERRLDFYYVRVIRSLLECLSVVVNIDTTEDTEGKFRLLPNQEGGRQGEGLRLVDYFFTCTDL